MRILFIHQNFPGQYRHLAQTLANSKQCEVVALGDVQNVRRQPRIQGVQLFGYKCAVPATTDVHPYVKPLDNAARRGQAVVGACDSLRKQGFIPDVIYAHPGWGEALFLRDVFPAARITLYCEFYYRSLGADVGFDPEFPCTADDVLRIRMKNAGTLLSMEACDGGISPTRWQQSTFPEFFRDQIEVIHDGIDTDYFAPAGNERLKLPTTGAELAAGDEIVTYVARNLEPYRGFHMFMRAVPLLQRRRPNAQIIVVGGPDVSYSPRPPEGETYKQKALDEVGSRIDMRRLHFLEWVPYAALRSLYRLSSVHVYLTYPFVLSWSVLEAMSTGCVVVGSRTAPVQEVIDDRNNGFLVDFFDPLQIADCVADVLANQAQLVRMRDQARRTIIERYDLRRVSIPAQLRSFGMFAV